MGSWLAWAIILVGVCLAVIVARGVFNRKYDYWIGRALAEDDARQKVKYLSKALAMNPGYAPGWGLKASALLALERYEEALECVEKRMTLDPNPVIWHEKGLCCYHLGRLAEAVQCFDKALAGCADKNSKLHEDMLHHRKLAAKLLSHKESA